MKEEAEEIIERVDIVEFISKYVRLRKSGKNFTGLCPFHKEKTPSFTVSPGKQIFYCFGCHEGGNVIHFLMKFERMSFQEALETIASQYGIRLKKRTFGKKTNYQNAMNVLADYYESCLSSSEKAINYLKARNIDEKIIEEFRIGYSDPQGRDLKECLTKSGIPLDIFFGTGIVRLREDGIYDIFRGRIVIPIRDVHANIIGFGGRTMESDGIPKYVNSPESPVFSKRWVLFGIDVAKRAILEKDEVYVVEGYFDFFSLYAAGIKNVIATLGTSITEEQLTKLRSYTENITFMLDGDEAGAKSALRLIPIVSEMDINGNIVTLPEGYDPDSLVRKKGLEFLNLLLKKKKPVIESVFDFYSEKYDMKKVENKISFIKAITPYIEGIKDMVKKRLYVKRISELVDVEEEYFSSFLERKEVAEPRYEVSFSTIHRKVIGGLLLNPEFITFYEKKGVVNYIKDEMLRKILDHIFSYYEQKRSIDVNHFILSLDEELKSLSLASIIEVEAYEKEEIQKILLDYLTHLEKRYLKEEAKRITESIKEAEKRGDDAELMRLLMEKREMILKINAH